MASHSEPVDRPPKTGILARIEARWPFEAWRDVNFVVAVSGGSDSVALVRSLNEIRMADPGRGQLVVAHYDHRSRRDSGDDAQWVRELAERLGLPCEVRVSDDEGTRSEEQLRNERHDFFVDTVHKTGARYLATGHTADDQVETVLFRLFRGTGLEGLGGVAPSRPLGHAATIVRPLLGVSRQEAIDYLASLRQSYRRDPSNASTEPTRNWIRHELLPLLEERFGPGVPEAVTRLASQAGESHAVIERLAVDTLREIRSASDEDGVALHAAGLGELEPAVAIEALRLAWREAGLPERAMTARHWRAMLSVARGEARSANLPGSYEARLKGDKLRVSRC